jgi:arginine repressor
MNKIIIIFFISMLSFPTAFSQDKGIMQVFEHEKNPDIGTQTILGVVEVGMAYFMLKELNTQKIIRNRVSRKLKQLGIATLMLDGTVRVYVLLANAMESSTYYNPRYAPLIKLTGAPAVMAQQYIAAKRAKKTAELEEQNLINILTEQGLEGEEIEQLMDRLDEISEEEENDY